MQGILICSLQLWLSKVYYMDDGNAWHWVWIKKKVSIQGGLLAT